MHLLDPLIAVWLAMQEHWTPGSPKTEAFGPFNFIGLVVDHMQHGMKKKTGSFAHKPVCNQCCLFLLLTIFVSFAVTGQLATWVIVKATMGIAKIHHRTERRRVLCGELKGPSIAHG
jgi:hypothetical protein